MRLMRIPFFAGLASFIGGATLLGCSPALDWREVRASAGGLELLFPCKPSSQERDMPAGAQRLNVHLQVCDASDQTFALMSVRRSNPPLSVDEQAEVERSLIDQSSAKWGLKRELPAAAPEAASAASSGSSSVVSSQLSPALTASLGRWTHLSGEQAQVLIFSRANTVFQLSVTSAAAHPSPKAAEGAETFFNSIQAPR